MFGGGTKGNEELTAQLGLVLLILLAAIGVTIPDLQGLITEHLFLGFLLLGPVMAKLGSTGYRFMRYYARNPAYRRKGPPKVGLRLIAPIVVLTTVVVFGSGIWLMIEGPSHRNPALTLHKLSFIVWLVFMALHVLGHLLELPTSLRAAKETREALPKFSPDARVAGAASRGTGGRWIALACSTVAGVVIAVALIPQFNSWTASGAIGHHHHRKAAVTSHIRPRGTHG